MVQKSITVHRHETSIQPIKKLKSPFRNITYWALFLSIIGFVLIAAFLAGALLSMYDMGIVRGDIHGLTPFLIGGAYLLVSALLLYPTVLLFEFSLRPKEVATSTGQLAMN